MPDLPDQVRHLVSERSKATRDRAQRAARALLEQAGLDQVAENASDRVSQLLEDILTASRTNRRMLEKLVAVQIEETASRLGFARQSEVDALRREVADLRVQVVPTPARRAAARKASGTRKGHTNAPAPASASTTSAASAPAKKTAKKTTKKTAPRPADPATSATDSGA